jgi:Tfp pilus assembly protein PilO
MRTLAASRLRLVVGLAGLNVVLAAGGWLLLVAPQRQHASIAAQQLQRARDQIAKLGPSAPQVHPKQPVIETADLYRLAQAMPTTADEPDLMLGLDQLAKSSGVKVLGISPGAPAAETGGFTQLPLTLTLQGPYGSLTGYLHRLRTLVSINRGALYSAGRLLSVTSVVLTPGPNGKQEQATVQLNAYAYGTLAGATPLPSTTTSTTSTSTTTASG